VRGADSPRWWLAEHLTGMGINFAATHASFSLLAGATVIAALKEPWVRTAVLTVWMLSALAVRLWAGRRFLRERAASVAPSAGANSPRGGPAIGTPTARAGWR
jgi:hypothetical protein